MNNISEYGDRSVHLRSGDPKTDDARKGVLDQTRRHSFYLHSVRSTPGGGNQQNGSR